MEISLTVNGVKHTLPIQPQETLAALLRYRLGLTGTKIGCGEMECGACTVLVDGEAVLSCQYPAWRAEGKEVLTIEGLARQSEAGIWYLHPLQQAFIEEGAVQCGFCIPAQIMAAYALLRQNPNPRQEDVRQALKDTLCRCGSYPAIERAIFRAAEQLRKGMHSLAFSEKQGVPRSSSLIGRENIRPDALEKVTGTAIYTDDLQFPNMLYGAVRRAGIPHAIVRSIDASRARALPGVHAVLLAEDVPGENNHGLVVYDWPVLVGVGERVRYVGDALAIVAAESEEIARKAAALIEVELEKLPPLTHPRAALAADAPALHPGGNLLKHIRVRKGDVKQGFSEADVILERTFYTPIYEHAFLEPECSIAVPTEDGRMEIYVGSQIPYADRAQVARALGWSPERVHIVGQTVGGGFGGKEDIAGQIHAALLANATGRPVKILFDRQESLLVHPKRHATEIRVKIGARCDGQLLAVETELYGDTGAYASLGEKVMTRATTHSAGPYEVPHVRADCYAVYTNNPPAGAFRGFGVTQSAFAIESMMDILAHKLELDPIELRRRNALRPGSVTSTGQVLRESVGLLECLERVEVEMSRLAAEHCGIGREALFKPHADPRSPHLIHAWGIAAAYKNTGLGGGAPDKAAAEVELFSDGNCEVRISSAELGQGLVSVLQLIVAQELQLPASQVHVRVMDTDLTPDGGPTTASRQTYVSGNAARLAAHTLRQAIASFLSEKYDLPPEAVQFVEGLAQINGQSLPLGKIAEEMRRQGLAPRALYEYWAPATRPLGEPGDMHFAFSFAVQAAEVEVNTRSGEVRVLRVISANDVGQAINLLTLRGQIEGGVVMGIGTALTEEFIVENGEVITDRLARYRVPSILHTPQIIPIIVEHPTGEGPYGAKGVGEIVSIPTAPAITNAIFNAVGVRFERLPVDQEIIALHLANTSAATER